MQKPNPHQPTAIGNLVRFLTLVTIGAGFVACANAQDQSLPQKPFDVLARFGKTLQASSPTLQPDDVALDNESELARKLNNANENAPPVDALNSKRLDTIYNKLNLIKKMIADEERMNAENPNANQSLNPTLDINSARSGSNDPAQPLPGPFDPIEPADSESLNSELAQPLDPPNSIQPGPAIGTGTPVVTKPVNSVELANSLFRTGNFAASRKSFEASMANPVDPAQTAWLKCFVGCCYRMEGNFEKAELTFREVSNSKHGYYPVDFARWSLAYIAQRRTTMERYALVEAEINGILKELKPDGK